MWGALVRQLVVFVLTRRGKRVIAIAGILLLGFLTALLVDLHMYLTAGFTGVVALAALIALAVRALRRRIERREQARHEAEAAIQRAIAAQARGQGREFARSAVVEARDRLSFWRNKNGPDETKRTAVRTTPRIPLRSRE